MTRILSNMEGALLPGCCLQAWIWGSTTALTKIFSETVMENGETTLDKNYCALSSKTKSFFFRIPILSFPFQNGPMQERFNENSLVNEIFRRRDRGLLKYRIHS